MANWYGTTRSNYFKVKDDDAFSTFMEDWDEMNIELTTDGWLLTGGDDNGGLQEWREDDDGKEYYFLKDFSRHLADGEIAIIMSAGAEKLRYVTGRSIAITNANKPIVIDIDDIYKKAKKKFGSGPSLAEY